jgi:glycine hydroxymethyltransferase
MLYKIVYKTTMYSCKPYHCTNKGYLDANKRIRIVRINSTNNPHSNKQSILFNNLADDRDVHAILQDETERQICSMELIASENFTSRSVMQANGTIFTNKYSEGYPGKRYYGGNEFIDKLEVLCQQRALEAFHLDPEEWHVNVQSYSGSPANFSVYTALLQPGDKLMGLDLPSGGHLTHGYSTKNKKISNSAIYFTSMPYKVREDTFLIDYKDLEESAIKFKPKLLIVGASAYPRDFNYNKFREIADKCGSFLMADIAHTSGLIASKLLKDPFEYCDVVTTTTHKTLRGPRGALIFCKKELKDLIDFAVFPSSQGGPHNNTIAGIAVALKQVASPEYKEYAEQVIKNSKQLAQSLWEYDFDLVTEGTDNHIVLVNLTRKGVTGNKFEKIAEMCNVSLNKNTIATDKSAFNPTGIRLGSPAMTSRGFVEKDFEFVARVLHEICMLCVKIQNSAESTKLVDFTNAISKYEFEIKIIKEKVSNYCKTYQLPK